MDQKIMSINLQTYKTKTDHSARNPSFTVTGNERKRNKTAWKSRINAQFSKR